VAGGALTCLECGAPMKVRHHQTVAYTLGGLPHVSLHDLDIWVCRNGHDEYVIPAILGLHRVIAGTLARKPERLTPDEIRYLRKYLGFSQVQCAAMMGVTPESVNRWESGAVSMAPTAERLLRLMVVCQDAGPDDPPLGGPDDDQPLEWFTRMKPTQAPARLTLTYHDGTWTAVAAPTSRPAAAALAR